MGLNIFFFFLVSMYMRCENKSKSMTSKVKTVDRKQQINGLIGKNGLVPIKSGGGAMRRAPLFPIGKSPKISMILLLLLSGISIATRLCHFE